MSLLSLLLPACSSPDDPGPAPTVVVIVVDGVRTEEFSSTAVSGLTGQTGEAWAPDLWSQVAPEGTVVRALDNTGITITAPAHAALLVGHPVPYANFPVDPDLGAGLYRPSLPTIFEEARAQAGIRSLLAANTRLLEGVSSSLYPAAGAGAKWALYEEEDEESPGVSDPGVTALVEGALDGDRARLVVANLHDTDRAGHYSPIGAYEARAADADEQAAALYGWIRENHPDVAKNLLYVVTADHGRHTGDTEADWRNHGDACDGCRSVPLFFAGTGVERGLELTGDYRAVDLTATIGAFLGISLPWAEGLPLAEAIPGLPDAARSGEISIAASGTLVATQVWRADRTSRSEVVVGDETVSTVGGLGAEAPAVLDGTLGPLACFRELTDLGDSTPWIARCLADGAGAWTDTGFPVQVVGPLWRPALVEQGGRQWAAWAENPTGVAETAEGTVGIAVSAWDGVVWTEPMLTVGWFPTDPVLVATDRGLVGAFGTSLGDPDFRYTRRVRVVPMTTAAGVATPSRPTDFALEDLLGAETRVELPALTATGDHVQLAMIGISADETVLATSTSEDGGQSWGDAVLLPDAGPPFVHLAPAWDGDRVVWGVFGGDGALLCRAAPGDLDATCVDVGSPRLQSFTVRDGVATVIRDAGTGEWERAEVRW